MLRAFLSVSVVLLLAGCASAPRPQMHLLAPKTPVVKAAPAPAVEAPVATPAPTFKSRFKKFTGHLRWTH